MTRSRGFPPIAGADARSLVLGSLPSRKSIEAREYYAHPQNAFWRIMGDLFGAGPDIPYARRTEILEERGIAVWDVLASSLRPGSMDSDIDLAAARANDFSSFLDSHAGIRRVYFNGRKAQIMFERLVAASHPGLAGKLTFETLPSTSPAFASMPYEEKLRKWSIVSTCR